MYGIVVGVQHVEGIAMLHHGLDHSDRDGIRSEDVILVHRDQFRLRTRQEIFLGHSMIKAEICMALEFIDVHVTIIA